MGLKYHLALAAVAALALAGCGGAATPAQNSVPSGLLAARLDEKTISAVLGFPAHVEPATVKPSADAVTCTFLADDQTSRPGVNISILVAPESFAAKALQDITDSAGMGLSSPGTVRGIVVDLSAHLALAAPAYGNFVSIASELDTDGRLAGRTVRDSRRTVEGMIPDPRPGSEQSFGCNPVP